jgi:hypothetical protein
MRWTLGALLIAILAWAAFMASPFIALYDLATAVTARDAERVAARVDLRALRLSLARQILSEYLVSMGRDPNLAGINRQLADSATAMADPLIGQLVTPEALIDVLDDGWPQQLAAPPPQRDAGQMGLGSLGEAWRVFVASEPRGFRGIVIPLNPDSPSGERLRLQMRLSGATWRLTGLDLPLSLRRELVKKLPRSPSEQAPGGLLDSTRKQTP